MMFWLLLIVISEIYCSTQNGTCEAFRDSDLFLNYSYGGDYFDICQKASRDSLEDKLGGCVGIFCNGTKYTGYTMARIVTNDICNMDIMGNVILSCSDWISELKNERYDIAVNKRSKVYGEIFLKAKEAVAYCCLDDDDAIKRELKLLSLTIALSVFSSAVVAGIISSLISGVYIRNLQKTKTSSLYSVNSGM